MPEVVVERTEADRARTVRHILADLREHRVEGAVAAEIREAVEEEELEVEADRRSWVALAAMGLVFAVLLALRCIGTI